VGAARGRWRERAGPDPGWAEIGGAGNFEITISFSFLLFLNSNKTFILNPKTHFQDVTPKRKLSHFFSCSTTLCKEANPKSN
jgi:hypothetical protein